jgi:hypothetical protein
MSASARSGDVEAHVLELLEAIAHDLHGLRADLADLARDRHRRSLSRVDRDRLQHLLPAIVGVMGSDSFTVAEILDEPGVRVATSGLTAPQVGRLLHRARNLPIERLMVEKTGTELHRGLCRVVEVVPT